VLACCFIGADFSLGQSLEQARELYRAGKLKEAAAAFRLAGVELEAEDPAGAATARNNACVLWRNTGDLDKAEEDCGHALRLRSPGQPTEGLARTLNNLGLVLQRQAHHDAARRDFERALEINVQLELAAGQAINLSNLGVNAIQAGWYAQAIDLFTRADRLAESHQEQPWAARQQEVARINLAVVNERLGAHREALRLYDAALADSDSMAPADLATLAVNRGVVYRNLGDPIAAERAFEEAERAFRGLGDRPALINVLLNRALVQHLNLERPDRAEHFYRGALRLAEELGEVTQRLQCLDYLGRFQLGQDRIDIAEALFSRAHALAVENGSSEAKAASLEGLGRCELARGQIHRALSHALAGIDEIEQVRGALESDTLRATYGADKRSVYSLAVSALALLDRQSPGANHGVHALRIVHRAKARELMDRLALDALPALPSDRPSPGRNRLLLEFFVGDDRLFAWVATADMVELRDLGPAAPTLAAASAALRRLSRGRAPDVAVVAELSERLLSAFPSRSLRATRWVVAPDRGLERLPFEILIDPDDGTEPLIRRVEMTYLPSGAMLDMPRPLSSSRVTIGIGAPATATSSGTMELLARRLDLGALEGASEELESLRRWIGEPVELRQGPRATEEEFAALYSNGARVLHIATHTVLDDRTDLSSAILLTSSESSDGLLHPAEIARIRGSSRLTVLAACRTAGFSGERDAALSGLTGSFLLSGSQSVVATLWDVGDDVTRAFMEQFYYGLNAGLRTDIALARAKRALIADPAWNDPSIWAAYVLIGDPTTVSSGTVAELWWLFLVVPGGALLVWLYGRTLKATR